MVGKNCDSQTGWMKEEVLEHSFQVDKFQQLWFVCIVSDVGVPKV